MTEIRLINHKYTVEQAFKECFYVVPDYQREYVWTEIQVSQLLEDIDEQIDSDSEYFIGTVLVAPIKDEEYHYDVIDGQQRLTTIFLILCALRVLFKDMQQGLVIHNLVETNYTSPQGDIKTNIKLDPRYENAGEVIEKIIKVNGDPKAVKTGIRNDCISTHGSIEKILNAYSFIYHFLTGNYNNEAKLKKYWGHLSHNVVFIQISNNVSSALKMFETINERGIGLNPMDLLKNLLFTQVPSDDFSKLKDEWKKITSPLEQNKEKPLRFLRYFLIANYVIKNEDEDATLKEDEIYSWISKREHAELTGYREEPIKFVRQIAQNVKQYIDLRNDENSVEMGSLKKLTGGAFSQHYILLLAAANLPDTFFSQFVTQLESFLFYHIFAKSPTNELERNFSTWANEIRSIAQSENSEEQREKLNRFIKNRFASNMDKKTSELNDALKRLTLDSTQKYRVKYLLARLTQYVDMPFHGQKERGSIDTYSKLEIEHILPDNPANDLRNTWQAQHTDSDYDEFKNRLGNLTLLEKPINVVAGNDFYVNKKPMYAESGNYLTRSLAGLADVGQNTSISRINEKLLSFEKWDAEDIETRQSLLVKLAHEVWKITEITN